MINGMKIIKSIWRSQNNWFFDLNKETIKERMNEYHEKKEVIKHQYYPPPSSD